MELTADFGTIVNRKSAASFLMYADHWPRIVPRFVSLKNTRDLISPIRNFEAHQARQVHPFVFETLPARNVLNDSCR